MAHEYASTISDNELREMMRQLYAVVKANMVVELRERVAKACAAAEDLDHCSAGHRTDMLIVAAEASRLLGIDLRHCEDAAADAMMNTRTAIVVRCVNQLFREIRQAAAKQERRRRDG